MPVGLILEDRETTFAPQWTGSALVRYTYPGDIAGGHVSIQGSLTYQSSVWQNLNNFDANLLPGRTLVDARIAWTSIDKKLIIAGFVKNLFDKRYDTVGFDVSYLTGGNLNSPGKPRTFGVNMSVNF